MSCSSLLQDMAVPYILFAARARTVRYREWHRWQSELSDDCCHLAGVHANRLLPSSLVHRRSCRSLCSLSGDDLHVDKVEVDGVSVAGGVVDLPYFRASGIRRLGRRVHNLALMKFNHRSARAGWAKCIAPKTRV
jgi:hypothetical protein